MFSIFVSLLLSLSVSAAFAGGNEKIKSFSQAKRFLPLVYEGHETTIYCACEYVGKTINTKSCDFESPRESKRSARLEWEHVVDAHAFGQSFSEWRDGAKDCKKKGRSCAEKNPEFARMEADLYNLWPIVGELNGKRSDHSMAEISGKATTFGGCRAKIQANKFEPEDEFKGIVARTYMYMDQAYPGHGIISNKNKKLFEAWNKTHPVSAWECERNRRIEHIQGNANSIVAAACKASRMVSSTPL